MYATSGANVKLTEELLDRGANPKFQKGNNNLKLKTKLICHQN